MARPKKDITRSEMVKVKLYPQEKKFIENTAKKNDISMSDLIRRGLNEIIEKGVNKYDPYTGS